jgi:hypothetical protein
MVTFRKDIHLGRRVPIRPEDENECMLVSISENGLAVDKYGRKWRFLPWGDILAVPTITLADVTVTEFPSLVGKTEAVWLVTLTHEDSEAEIWYKVVKNGDESEAYSKYVEPIKLKSNGTYQIVAKAKKEGQSDSVVVRSDSFKVTRVIVSETYGKPIITAFSYTDFPASGDTKLPTFKYSQSGERRYTDGSVEALTPITTGATCNFYGMDGLTPSTGGLTVGVNTITWRHEIGTVYVTVTMHGVVSDTAECKVYQLAAAKQNNYVDWVIEPPHSVSSGQLIRPGVDFQARARYGGDVSYYYKEGSTNVTITSAGITITRETVIYAEVAETTYYKKATTQATVYVEEQVQVYYGWGMNYEAFRALVDTPDGGIDLIDPKSEYEWGQLAAPNNAINGQIINPMSGVVWIAKSMSAFPKVVIKQNGQAATLNWADADSSFNIEEAGGVRRVYHIYYTIFEDVGLLEQITWQNS